MLTKMTNSRRVKIYTQGKLTERKTRVGYNKARSQVGTQMHSIASYPYMAKIGPELGAGLYPGTQSKYYNIRVTVC